MKPKSLLEIPEEEEIKLPMKLTLMTIYATDNSEDSKDHDSIRQIIAKSFGLKENDSLDQVCLDIANKVKKTIWPREKPKRSAIVGLYAKAQH